MRGTSTAEARVGKLAHGLAQPGICSGRKPRAVKQKTLLEAAIMPVSETPTNLMERHRQGDAEATALIFAHYAQRLSRVAEQHLSRKLAGRVDGEDVVQSVFRTFFRRTLAGEFQIDSSEQLWQLLVKITVRKAQAQGRRHTAAMRDISAETPVTDSDAIARLADHEPGPAEAAILLDQIEVLLNNLPAMYCDVLDWRLQGHSATDIANRLGVSRRSVYRALELLGHRLEKMSAPFTK
jgi:RNA polymerase sigma-70 factor (ECF subfamily)